MTRDAVLQIVRQNADRVRVFTMKDGKRYRLAARDQYINVELYLSIPQGEFTKHLVWDEIVDVKPVTPARRRRKSG